MDKLKNKLRDLLSESPLFETLVFTGSVIVSGILCGSFVNELTVNNKVQWENAFKILPTYLIIAYIIVVYKYNKFLYNQRMDTLKFSDEIFAAAYVRKELLPEVVKDFKKDMREGKPVDFNKFDDFINVKDLMKNYNSDKKG